MASHSASQRLCSQIIAQSRSRTSLLRKRHQSTFSFFSRSQEPLQSAPFNPTHDSQFPGLPIASASATASHPNALKISPAFANAAPLLAAIQNKDQDTAWMVYSVLSRAGQLPSLLPIHHSLLLRSIRPETLRRFTKVEVATLTERIEQVWAGMFQCQIQPDINDYSARLEFFVHTRQYQMVDVTWTQIRERATAAADIASVATAGSTGQPPLQPTLHIYKLVLQSCVPRKNIGLAMETITLMRRSGIKPDSKCWDYVLQIHTAMKNWAAVEHTFRSAFITTAVSGSAHSHQPSNGSNGSLKSSMIIPLGQRPTSLHGGSLPSNSTNRVGNKDKLVPTLENIHTLFSFYAYTQDLEDLRSMFDSHVRLFGLVPTTRTYNEMIKFAFLAQKDSEGMDLFRELVQIGQNMDKVKQNTHNEQRPSSPSTHSKPEATGLAGAEESLDQHSEALTAPLQVFGPDFDTFQILINNELIMRRRRWGRAWKWMQVMQEGYGLVPSDAMFRRTLTAMKRRKGADEATLQALQENWDRVRARQTGSSAV
ncbi:hypothetical protein KVV02_005715 [Mortierella alpina]|uniref:Uncharacterized protein n=1 Tax=Mortierella alpina TaxID=64518 RepID=A0A9P8D0L8_MORAP|nr:hypothetical protein KVV02_005715 [Mortierella alpina]